SRLVAAKRRLLQAAALGALAASGALIRVVAAWGQISETLPEVTVTAPRSASPPPRRAKPVPRRAASSAPAARQPAPAPTPAPAPAPTVTAPSPFQFVAPTPITGLGMQGLAVYMQGIRVNEAFGDTVNWDLIPKVAIGRSDISTNNPAFGLNAPGGAISFQMKAPTAAPSSIPQAAPTAGSAAPCNTGCATGNGGSIWQRKASRTTAGATSRHRGWRASTAISAGR